MREKEDRKTENNMESCVRTRHGKYRTENGR